MPVATGLIRTSDIAEQKVPVHMDEKIHLEETSTYQFELITRMFRPIEQVTNMKVEFMEHELYKRVMTCSAVESGTTISVDLPEIAHRDHGVYNTRTHETYLMNEDIGGTSSSGKITVVNQTGSGSISNATAVGDLLIVQLEAHAEGEALPLAYTNKPTFYSTYLQESDEKLTYTKMSQKQREYGMDQYLIDRKLKWISYKQGQNLKMLLGGEVRDTTSGDGRRHMMRGLRDWITSNRQNMGPAGGVLSLATIGEMMRETNILGASSGNKIGIAGSNSVTALSALPASHIQTTVSETKWGKKLKNIVTPFGDISFTYDKTLSAQYGLADNFIIIDPVSIHRLQYSDFVPRLLLNITNAEDIHNTVDAITGTFGMKVVHESLCAWAYGIN